jgi:hypothetical protein
MDSARLKNIVDSCLANEPFVLTADQLDSPAVAGLLQSFLPDGKLALSGAVLEPASDGETILVAGRLNYPLFGIANLRATVALALAGEQATMVLTLSELPAGWQLSGSFPALAGTLIDDLTFDSPTFILDSREPCQLPPDFQTVFGYPVNSPELERSIKRGLRFQSRLRLQGESRTLAWLLNGAELLDVAGPIELYGDIPRMCLTTVERQSLTLGPLDLAVQFQCLVVLEEFAVMLPSGDPQGDALDNPSGDPQGDALDNPAAEVALDTVLAILPQAFARLDALLRFDSGKSDPQTPAGTQALEIPLTTTFYGGDLALLTFESNLAQASSIMFDKVATLLGGADLPSLIPHQLPALDDISLDYLSFMVSAADKRLLGISARVKLDAQLGIASGAVTAQIRDLGVLFSVTTPLEASHQANAAIFGTVDITSLDAPIDGYVALPELFFECNLAEGAQVDLTHLLQPLLPDTSCIPAIICDEFCFSGNARDSRYAIAAWFSGGSPNEWKLKVGTADLALTDVFISAAYDPALSPAIQGEILAALQIGDATFGVNWLLPGGLLVQGAISQIGLRELATTLCGDFMELPQGFPEIVCSDALCTISAVSDGSNVADYDLTLATDVNLPDIGDLGSVLFELRKNGTGFGFMCGFLVPEHWSPAAIWSEFAGMFRDLRLSGSGLILSSLDTVAVLPSNLQHLSGLPLSISKGVTFFSALELDGPILGVIKKLFDGKDTVNLAAVIASDPSKTEFVASLGAEPVGKKSVSFNGLELMLLPGQESFDLRSGATIKIGSDLLDFQASGTLAPTGALTIGLSLRGVGRTGGGGTSGPGWENPFGIHGLTINGVGGSLSVEGEGFTIGLEGAITIGDAAHGDELLFDVGAQIIDGEAPGALIASLRADPSEARGVTLPQLIKGFTSFDLSQAPLLGDIALKQLSVYIVSDPNGFPSPIDPTVVYRGLTVHADVFFFGLEARADMEFQYASGLYAKGWLSDKIDLGGVLLIADASGTQGASFLIDTRQLAGAGPSGDYLAISGQISLFNLVGEKLEAHVTKDSFCFDLAYHLAGFEDFTMRCTLSGMQSFSAGATVSFGLHNRQVMLKAGDVAIGTFMLDTNVGADLEIGLTRDTFSLAVAAHFAAAPNLPELSFDFTIHESFKDLGQLIEKTFDQITALGWELFKPILDDPKHLFDLAGKGIIVLSDDVGDVLKTVYRLRPDQAIWALKNAGYSSLEIGKILKHTFDLAVDSAAGMLAYPGGYTASEAAATLKNVYSAEPDLATKLLGHATNFYSPKDVADALESIYHEVPADQAVKFLHAAGYSYLADSMGDILTKTYKIAPDQAVTFLRAAGFSADEVGVVLKSYQATADQATQWLRGVGYSASDVIGMFAKTYWVLPDGPTKVLRRAGYSAKEAGDALQKYSPYVVTVYEAPKLFKEAGYTANEVGDALKNAYGQSVEQATPLLKGAGYTADEVGDALKNTFGESEDQVINRLKREGHSLNEVVDLLKNTYGVTTIEQAARLLSGAGYIPNDVANELSSVYSATADQAAQWFRGAGHSANEVYTILRTVYGAQVDQAAGVLHRAGYAASEVGDVLKNVSGAPIDEAAGLLRGAGYAVNEVGDVLKNVYSAPADQTAQCLRGAGYTVSEVGGYITDAFSYGPDQLKTLLGQAGFAEDQVKSFFQSLGGSFSDVFKSVGDHLNPTHW